MKAIQAPELGKTTPFILPKKAITAKDLVAGAMKPKTLPSIITTTIIIRSMVMVLRIGATVTVTLITGMDMATLTTAMVMVVVTGMVAMVMDMVVTVVHIMVATEVITVQDLV